MQTVLGLYEQYHWAVIATFAFVGGIVCNIVQPKRRGAAGFTAAATIGVFCGGLAAICAFELGSPIWLQYMVSGSAGVLGDRFLSSVLCDTPLLINIRGNNTVIGDGNEVGHQQQQDTEATDIAGDNNVSGDQAVGGDIGTGE